MWCCYSSPGRGPRQVITLCLPPVLLGRALNPLGDAGSSQSLPRPPQTHTPHLKGFFPFPSTKTSLISSAIFAAGSVFQGGMCRIPHLGLFTSSSALTEALCAAGDGGGQQGKRCLYSWVSTNFQWGFYPKKARNTK